jgi:hypothetical protein
VPPTSWDPPFTAKAPLPLALASPGSPRRESVRLRNAVSDIRMPMDILVVPESRFRALRDKVGLIYREAALRGKVVYEAEG